MAHSDDKLGIFLKSKALFDAAVRKGTATSADCVRIFLESKALFDAVARHNPSLQHLELIFQWLKQYAPAAIQHDPSLQLWLADVINEMRKRRIRSLESSEADPIPPVKAEATRQQWDQLLQTLNKVQMMIHALRAEMLVKRIEIQQSYNVERNSFDDSIGVMEKIARIRQIITQLPRVFAAEFASDYAQRISNLRQQLADINAFMQEIADERQIRHIEMQQQHQEQLRAQNLNINQWIALPMALLLVWLLTKVSILPTLGTLALAGYFAYDMFPCIVRLVGSLRPSQTGK